MGVVASTLGRCQACCAHCIADLLDMIRSIKTKNGWKVMVVDRTSMRVINAVSGMFDILENGVTGAWKALCGGVRAATHTPSPHLAATAACGVLWHARACACACALMRPYV